jgi:hypothetical protein
MILDGLSGIDDAWVTQPSRHDAWLRARSRIVDQLLTSDAAGTALANRRAFALLLGGATFARGRLERRQGEGTTAAREWARTLADDGAEMVGSALGTSLIDLFDVLRTDPDARDALLGLLAYSSDDSSGSDAFGSTIAALIDSFQTLDDEANVIPLLIALGPIFAPNAEAVVASGGTLEIDASVHDDRTRRRALRALSATARR